MSAASVERRCSTRSCQALIRMAVAESGKTIPVDPEPVADGNLVWRKVDGQFRMHVLGKGEEPVPGERRFRSHFVSCTRPEAHRKPALRVVEDLDDTGPAPDVPEVVAPPVLRLVSPGVAVRAETRTCCTPGHNDGRPARLCAGGVFCDECLQRRRGVR